MWNVNEIVANIRKGDNTKTFEELGIEVCSRLSGYRSVHYLIESYPTTEKVIIEVQVRTIFEEGYGEMLLNRIAGSSDEMASLINLLSKNFKDIESEYNKKIEEKNKKILELKENILKNEALDEKDKKLFIKNIESIIN